MIIREQTGSKKDSNRSVGAWVKQEGDWWTDWYSCSECGLEVSGKPNYCPNCGADMRGTNKVND